MVVIRCQLAPKLPAMPGSRGSERHARLSGHNRMQFASREHWSSATDSGERANCMLPCTVSGNSVRVPAQRQIRAR